MKLYSLAPLLVFATIVIGLVVIASIATYFQRTTTFMETKYINRPSDEIDALYVDPLKDIVEDDYYSDNIIHDGEFIPSDPCLANDEDDDNDGLSNKEEIILGLDCRAPDTDGDGVADGADADPLDFRVGGINTTFSFDLIVPPSLPSGALTVKEFYKNVINITAGETQWKNYITANTHDLLRFFVHIDVENTHASETKSATLYDILQTNEFTYTNNLQIFINGIEQPYSELLDYSWYNGYSISVSPTETKTYDLYFTATVKTTTSSRKVISNIIKLDIGEDYRSWFDQIFVIVSK